MSLFFLKMLIPEVECQLKLEHLLLLRKYIYGELVHKTDDAR